MSKIVFSLETDDSTAVVSGLVVPHPLTKQSKPVANGFIQLTPNRTDSVELAPGKYVYVYQINGDGSEVTITVATGDVPIKQKKVDPNKTGFHNLWFHFEVK